MSDRNTTRLTHSHPVSGRWRYAFVIAVACVGIVMSVVAFRVVQAWDHQQIEANFEQTAIDTIADVKSSIESDLDVLLAVRSLYAASDSVDRDGFGTFVNSFLPSHPGIQALEWIPRVSDSERAAYEETAREEAFPEFQIFERNAEGVSVPATLRQEYFPVYYLEPYEGNEAALGFDLASNPVRMEALNEARDTGQMVATARITLVQETKNQFGFLVFAPVYRNGSATETLADRRENLAGFVLGVFRAGVIVEQALSHIHHTNSEANSDIFLYDRSAPPDQQLLFPGNSGTDGKEQADSPHRSVATIDVAGRDWDIVVTSSDSRLPAWLIWQPWSALALGLLFTGLLSSYLLTTMRRAASIERLVVNRTAELSESNLQLEEEVAERERVERALRRSEEDTRQLSDENATIAEIGRVISSAIDSSEVYERFAQEVLNLIPFERLAISMVDFDTSTTSLIYVTGMEVPGKSVGDSISLANTLTDAAINARMSILLDEDDMDEVIRQYPSLEETVKQGALSFLTTPLISNDRVVGVMHMRSTIPRAFTLHHQALAERVASQIAGAMAQSMLYADLEKAEVELKGFFDLSIDMLCIAGMDGHFKRVNKGFEKTLGYTSEELLAKSYLEFVHPEDVKATIAVLRSLANGVPTSHFENRFACKDGSYKWLAWTAMPDVERHIMYAAARDITEARHAEEALRDSDTRVRAILNNIIDGIITIDERGIVRSFSIAAEGIFGYA